MKHSLSRVVWQTSLQHAMGAKATWWRKSLQSGCGGKKTFQDLERDLLNGRKLQEVRAHNQHGGTDFAQMKWMRETLSIVYNTADKIVDI
jgi:hypothetical protein